MSDQTLNINHVVHIEKKPANHHRVAPFSVTLHFADGDLTAPEVARIKDAIVNVAHEIRRSRGDEEVFYWRSK